MKGVLTGVCSCGNSFCMLEQNEAISWYEWDCFELVWDNHTYCYVALYYSSWVRYSFH